MMSLRTLEDALSHEFLEDVNEFWFRHLKNSDHIIAPDVEDAMQWFSQIDAYDRECVARFSTQLKLIESSQATGADILAVAKPSTPQQWMSLIILLDQLPRNCFRGARVDIAYTFFDGLALEVAFRAIDFGVPRAPEVRFRLAYVFWFYMPLEHSENMEVQEALANAHISMWQDFQQLMEGSVEELNSDTVNCRTVLLKREHSFEKFKDTIRGICDDHRDLIRRFGRFPYRNEALGRSTTDEELQFLEQR